MFLQIVPVFYFNLVLKVSKTLRIGIYDKNNIAITGSVFLYFLLIFNPPSGFLTTDGVFVIPTSTLMVTFFRFDECNYILSVITPEISKADFENDETLKRAVIRSLEIIGEATKKHS